MQANFIATLYKRLYFFFFCLLVFLIIKVILANNGQKLIDLQLFNRSLLMWLLSQCDTVSPMSALIMRDDKCERCRLSCHPQGLFHHRLVLDGSSQSDVETAFSGDFSVVGVCFDRLTLLCVWEANCQLGNREY